MRFTKLTIDGFGRFADTALDLAPCLQVVFGPNEGGKSTLRYFIADMLYGQKRSAHKRLYEDGNALRTPWQTSSNYGGKLAYQLDSGLEIEVERVFSPDREEVRVFDRTNGTEITDEFPQLRNKEPTFAERHLNMSKSVFLGVATISHVTLSDLGDRQALVHIREKLLSLTDSADEDHSAEKAIKSLQDRIAIIGDKNARTRPLPIMRQRLGDLQAEYQEVYEAARETAVYEKRRAAVLDEIGALRNRRADLERQLAIRDRSERAEIVRRAEALQARIDELTKDSFALSAVREFPLDRQSEVRRLATLLESAESALQQTSDQLAVVMRERDNSESKLTGQGIPLMREAEPEWESKLAEIDKQIGLLNERIEYLENTMTKGENIFAEAERTLKELPDFSRFLTDPVQHFTTLAGAHDVARRALEDEERRLATLKQREIDQDAELEAPRGLYADRPDFVAELRAHEAGMQESYAAGREREREQALLQQQADDLAGRFPGFVIMTFGGLAGVIVLAVVATITGNPGIFVATFLLGAMSVFFASASLINRQAQGRAREQLSALTAEEVDEKTGRDTFDEIMQATGCNTLRELEAAHDRYREMEQTLSILRGRITEQEAATDQARDRLQTAELALNEAFASAGEPEGSRSPQERLSRVLTRYQEYRDCKRKLGESREAQERSGRELEGARRKLEATRQKDVDLSLTVREFLRENHFPDEHQFESALKALRNYRIRSAQMRQRQGELEVIQGQVKVIRRQLDSEQAERDRLRVLLDDEFAAAEVSNLDEYGSRAGQAEQLRELSRTRASLEEQLTATLGDHDLDRLREEMLDGAQSGRVPELSADALKGELANAQADLDAKRKQEHALQLMITERAAGHRTRNEVEEERAATEQRVAELELELTSATYAISVLQKTMRNRHTRLAPALASLASEYMERITNGVYNEVIIDSDMQISVRIPQTRAINPDPARLLSKGTVDQIYFALRLAMIKCLGENGEKVPMVLDDPFANYDDKRLHCAMQLLADVGETHQVIMFTCREDVVRAAESVGAPIIRL